MLANLLTTLIIACGVGVSSFEDHNPNIQKNELYSENIGLTNYVDSINIINNNEYIYFDSSLDLSNSNIIYQLPSYDDVVARGLSIDSSLNIQWWDFSTSSYKGTLTAYFEYDDVDNIYYFKARYPSLGAVYFTYIIYSLDNQNRYYFNQNFFDLYNIDYKLSRISTDEYLDIEVYKFFTFYLSTYRFKGSIYNFYDSKPVHLFSTALINDFFGLSSIHGLKTIYKGWYKHNGVYYDTIRATCVDAQGTKYYKGVLSGSSSSLSTMPSTANTYIYLMNIEFYNSVIDYSYYAYQPVSYTYDNTISAYIDISANGWRDNKNIEFLSISIDGKPQGRSDLNNLGYYDFITHDNDLISSSNNGVSNYWLNSSFNLINSALVGLGGLFSIQILPFVNLGTLIFLPLLFVIVLAVVKLFKR